MAPQQLFQALSQDLGSLLNNQNFSDVKIVVGKTQNTRTFNAHSPILGARSSYFVRDSLMIVLKEKIIPLFSTYPIYHLEFLKWFLEHGILAILELLVAADELSLKNLTNYLEDYLIEHHAKMLEENFASLHETSFMHDSFKKLQEFCTQIAAKSPAIIFRSQDFTSLNKSFLSSILSRNYLIMEESQIWEKVVEWGVAKLGSNIDIKEISNWTDENFEVFKEIIEEFLPLIRFFHISSVDFYYKVKPFEKILPETLYEDLLHHYLVPGSHQMSVDAQPLRCSRDGFSPADFHRLCDNKGATVSVIKVKGTGQLIGGYNPQSWSCKKWLDGKGSFIFSLGDGKAENAKLSKSISEDGPYDSPNRGPEFGELSIIMKSEDFQNKPGCSCGKDTEYEHAIMPNLENGKVNFLVEEYEVFRIRNQKH
ncbi:hypothetical protein G9A89_002632 [Geosiphon pyriformis]|nr:hypothetical protein G9A89_002632 [Geosiphon pyriformis]